VQSTLFVVNKDEWDTKEDRGKVHEECTARTAVWQKAPLRAEAMLNSKKIKPVALAIVELREFEGIS